MPAYRFFIPEGLLEHQIYLEGEEVRHLSSVMRRKTGDIVELIDGKGRLAQAEITSLEKKQAVLQKKYLIEKHAPQKKIHLILPLLSPSKLDWVLEKAAELGADHFWLYSYEEKRTLSENRKKRIEQILIAAMKQSGRLFLPSFTFLSNRENIQELPGPFFFCQEGKDWISGLPEAETSYWIIGPEKGFSEKELTWLEKLGKGVCLSTHTLRAETAPLALLSLLGPYRT